MKKLLIFTGMLALTCSSTAMAATVVDFSFTGADQTWIVPVGVSSVYVEAWGAQGYTAFNQGGLGGFTTGTLGVTSGQTLRIYVGGAGTVANVASPMGGGFNGGGDGVSNFTSSSSSVAGGGGGATDIRLSAIFSSRLIVAGGGGGATANFGAFGGAGGGATGGNGGTTYTYTGGTGGTQVSGGSFGGVFGEGGDATSSSTPWIGGGGGGWYGGGVAAAHSGGGGGSSYIGGVTGGTMMQGVRAGNGALRLTFDMTSAVPEPSTWAMMLFGFAGIGFTMRRRKGETATARGRFATA